MGGCSIQSAGALALRARREANISLAFCFVGGAGALCERATDGLVARYSVFLFYWYKSTNYDAGASAPPTASLRGTHFTCCTGTKVRIMTQVRRSGNAHAAS